MKVIQFLDEKDILWQPIGLDNKIPIPIDGILAKVNDYKTLSKQDIISRRYLLSKTDYIAIYTDKYQQVDIDNDKPFKEDLKFGPYFKSVSKGLPHYFVKIRTEKERTAIEQGDILSGQWSYCHKDALIYDNEKAIPSFKISDFGKKEFKYTKNSLKKEVIDKIKYRSDLSYPEWIETCWGIYNVAYENQIDNPHELVHYFSKFSEKYDEKAIEIINNIKYNENGINISTLLSYKKEKKTKNEHINISLIKYEDFKIKFEETHFKCLHDGLIYEINKNKVYSFTISQTMDKYGHIDCLLGDDITKFIKEWLKDNDMRTYKNVGSFFSNDDCPDDTFNLFLGFDVNFIESFQPNEEQLLDLQFILNHFKFLCNNEEDLYDYVIKWYAHMFKFPSKRNNIAIFFKSKQGAGKNLSTNFIFNLIGSQHCSTIADIERDVFGTFNPLLKNKLLIVFDEMDPLTGIKNSDRLKALITGETIDINEKHKGLQTIFNNSRFVLFSNNDFCIKIENNDRRFLNIESILPIPDNEYFIKFVKLMNDKQIQRLFYEHLLSIDIDDKYDWINNRPLTQLTKEMKASSLEPYENFLLYFCNNSEETTNEYTCTQLLELYKTYAINNSITYSYNTVKLGIKLSKCKLPFISKRIKENSNRYTINFVKAKEYIITNGFSEFI